MYRGITVVAQMKIAIDRSLLHALPNTSSRLIHAYVVGLAWVVGGRSRWEVGGFEGAHDAKVASL